MAYKQEIRRVLSAKAARKTPPKDTKSEKDLRRGYHEDGSPRHPTQSAVRRRRNYFKQYDNLAIPGWDYSKRKPYT